MKDKKVDYYIEKQKSPQKEICISIRSFILKSFPKLKEEMKWGVPSYDNGKFYFVSLKDHVNFGFSIKGLSKEELELFDSGGKTMKVIEIKSKSFDKKRILKLMKLVLSKN